MSVRVLLVDSDPSTLASLSAVMAPLARVDAVAEFGQARELLLRNRYDRLIANLRLGSYNGLHLVYLADPDTRGIIYTDEPEFGCEDDVRGAGAFYEYRGRLPHNIAGYLSETLPWVDRRDGQGLDRRNSFRGGRRRADSPTVYLLGTAARGAAARVF